MNLVVEKPAAQPAPDFAAIRQRQQATWRSGDYALIGTALQIVGGSYFASAASTDAGTGATAEWAWVMSVSSCWLRLVEVSLPG